MSEAGPESGANRALLPDLATIPPLCGELWGNSKAIRELR